VRRFTLITIIVLALLLVGAAIYQLLVPRGEPRFPGGPLTPSATPRP
jgi:hypothetical protein